MQGDVTFRGLLWDGCRVVGARLEDRNGATSECNAAIVVGADGIWSAVARAANAVAEIEHPSLTCGYYAYWSGVATDGVEFYVREGRDILVFPTHDGLTCIWAGRSRKDWEMYRKDVEQTYGSSGANAARGKTTRIAANSPGSVSTSIKPHVA